MAVSWQIWSIKRYVCLVLWLVFVSLDRAESSTQSVSIKYSTKPKYDNFLKGRFERETDDESLPDPVSHQEEDVDQEDTQATDFNENIDSIISQEKYEDSKFEEGDEIKPKTSNKHQKYIPNYFKNNSKVFLNDSFYEKRKPEMYSPQVLKNSNISKKDSKMNNNKDLKINSSTYAAPNSFVLNTTQFPIEPHSIPVSLPINFTNQSTNLTKTPQETLLMSDQPVEEIAQNSTDSSEDDSEFSSFQNTTSSFEDNNGTTSADGRTMPPSEGFDFVLISGIILGTTVVLGLAAGGGFAVYRHRVWNKPQTLSDKCSNADSSGYIDDSTLRENSEEMYSLDNDSFLNSLEAMTIQNYWTDNVKHTKL